MLLARGFSMEQIAQITAKRARLKPAEAQFIEGFCQTGVFDIRDCSMQIPADQYRYPNEDYYQNSSGQPMSPGAPEMLLNNNSEECFRMNYPDFNVSLTSY